MTAYREFLGLNEPEPLDPDLDPAREAIRQLLAPPPWNPAELAERLGITKQDLLKHWNGEDAVPDGVSLKTARLLESRAQAMERLAVAVRGSIWASPPARQSENQ
jgi:hypothetical protein